MSDFDLRRLQLTELQILEDITDFCDKNNIVYYLFAGTLLGSVRHEGFIPWDDDIDICMDMKNYKKFLKVSDELQPKYFVQNYKTDRKLCYSWTKVMLNRTALIHDGMNTYDIHQGIYIDIFMISGIANGTMRQKIQRKALKVKHHLLRKYYLIEVKDEKPDRISIILPEFMRRPLISFMERLSNIDINKCNTCFSIEHWNLSMAPKYDSKFFSPKSRIKLSFEGKDFFCPGNYQDYLFAEYGDWQKLPPLERRINHNNCIVDFENNYTQYIIK